MSRWSLRRRKRKAQPWHGKRCFEFSGVFYAADAREEGAIGEAIASAVCPNGGTLIYKPARPFNEMESSDDE